MTNHGVGEIVPRYSRRDASKRIVLNSCFKRQRAIMDLSIAYGLKYQRARTYVNQAKEAIENLLPFTIRDSGIPLYTTSDIRQLVRAAKTLFLDDRSRNFYLAAPEKIRDVFEKSVDIVEYPDTTGPVPQKCSIVVTTVECVHEFVGYARVKVVIAFGDPNKPVPTSFFETGTQGSIELWTLPLAPFYIALWRR